MPIPRITIEAKPLLLLRAGARVALQAKAKLAACFVGAYARGEFALTVLDAPDDDDDDDDPEGDEYEPSDGETPDDEEEDYLEDD